MVKTDNDEKDEERDDDIEIDSDSYPGRQSHRRWRCD